MTQRKMIWFPKKKAYLIFYKLIIVLARKKSVFHNLRYSFRFFVILNQQKVQSQLNSLIPFQRLSDKNTLLLLLKEKKMETKIRSKLVLTLFWTKLVEFMLRLLVSMCISSLHANIFISLIVWVRLKKIKSQEIREKKKENDHTNNKLREFIFT